MTGGAKKMWITNSGTFPKMFQILCTKW